MSCILAFMTEDNYRAVGEMNAAVAAPIGENQLEVESGGVEGESGSSDEESDGSSDMEEFVVLCLLHVYVFSCIFLFSWYGTTTQRFVPDSLKLRTARFEHAHRWFAEQSHIDHAIK